MASNGLTFKLFGEDVSASETINALPGVAKKAAGAVGAAIAGAGVASAISSALDASDATAKFKAQLGGSAKSADELGKLAGSLYADGWGENLDDVQTAMRAVGDQGLVDLTDDSLDQIGKITGYAQTLSDTFGIDVVESSRAAGQMIKNGLAPDAETAFDIISTGMQNGADRSGDFLDTLTEYSPHFAKLGIDGPTAVGMITAGLDNGIFTADLATDAFKEFAIRSIDGSKLTGDAYAALGLNADDMAARIAAGGPTATTATGEIMTALGNMTDPIAQETAGVALFGTQWEDSGARSILAMNPVTTKTVEVKDATQKMGDALYDTANNKVERIKRGFDHWIQSMIDTKGPMGEISAAVITFGPQALGLAGSVAMIATALKGTAVMSIAARVGVAIFASSAAAALAPVAVAAAAILAAFYMINAQLPGIRGQMRDFAAAPTVGAKAQVASTFYGNNGQSLMFNKLAGHATGGVVMPQRGGRAILAGEAGEPEAVVPLSKWDAMTSGDGGGSGVTVNVNVNGSYAGSQVDLAKTVVDAIQLATRQGVIPSGVFGSGAVTS